MALKAGYVGVKRWLYEKLVKDVSTLAKEKISWKDYALTGVRNFFDNPAVSGSDGGLTFTVNADKSITVSGTCSSAIRYAVVSSFDTSKYAGLKVEAGPVNDYSTSSAGSVPTLRITEANGDVVQLIPNGTIIEDHGTKRLNLRIPAGDYSGTNAITFSIMFVDPDDPAETYIPYAMTNQQLTESADDQKTTINAIISAATGAADFAVFKSAMEALTPLTRSAAPEKRSLDVEVEEPEEVVKKSTKKTTKKEVE